MRAESTVEHLAGTWVVLMDAQKAARKAVWMAGSLVDSRAA